MSIKKLFLSSIIFSLILGTIFSIMNTASASAADKKIVVYYFHGNLRCQACTKIEELTKKAVNTGFADKIKNSIMKIEIINFDKHENKHFIKDYNLDVKSVIVSEFDGAKLVRWKNLENIWDYYNNESAFIKYIQNEVKEYL